VVQNLVANAYKFTSKTLAGVAASIGRRRSLIRDASTVLLGQDATVRG